MKSDSNVNHKLVNDLKRLWFAKIDRKILLSLVLTTNQINTPIGYLFRISSAFSNPRNFSVCLKFPNKVNGTSLLFEHLVIRTLFVISFIIPTFLEIKNRNALILIYVIFVVFLLKHLHGSFVLSHAPPHPSNFIF